MLHAVVADPNAEVQHVVTDALKSIDANVKVISDMSRLLIKVEKSRPSLLLIDYATLRALEPASVRALRARIPMMSVLMLLAEDHLGAEFSEMLGIGTTDFLTKPFDRVQLLHRLRILSAMRGQAMVGGGEHQRSVEAILAALHDPATGRLDASRFSQFLALPLQTIAKSLGRPYAGVYKTPNAESLQPQLQDLRRVLELLLDLVGTQEAALIWLNTPSKDLADQTPIALIREGHVSNVRDLLENVMAGGTA